MIRIGKEDSLRSRNNDRDTETIQKDDGQILNPFNPPNGCAHFLHFSTSFLTLIRTFLPLSRSTVAFQRSKSGVWESRCPLKVSVCPHSIGEIRSAYLDGESMYVWTTVSQIRPLSLSSPPNDTVTDLADAMFGHHACDSGFHCFLVTVDCISCCGLLSVVIQSEDEEYAVFRDVIDRTILLHLESLISRCLNYGMRILLRSSSPNSSRKKGFPLKIDALAC